jgi:hypothetical protein
MGAGRKGGQAYPRPSNFFKKETKIQKENEIYQILTSTFINI